MEYSKDEQVKGDLAEFESKYKKMSKEQMAEEAVNVATRQLMTSTDFKKPRMAKLTKYYELYDGKTTKKLRQLFNVPIPVFAGMVDTLNAQYDTPISIKFQEGDASDYFKVQKINGAFQKEILDTSENSKWDAKLSTARKHAIMTGRAILKYHAESDPEYESELENVILRNFHFQPRGGLSLENHLFAGEEDIEKTKAEIVSGALAGEYDMKQVKLLLARCSDSDYLPDNNQGYGEKLARFRPLGLDPENNNYVGEQVYKLASWIINIDGERYYLCFHPWSKTWLRFEKWTDINSSGLLPWVSFATHEDDENFLSKSFSDDIYSASDAIVAMFNQELTNREKRNFGARAYDKDMFTDVRKLDESMHRPDALVPVDTKGGTRRISEGIYEFKVGELGGTVNLIDWITGSLGRNTGANDLSMGSVQDVSKKASVTFAEQKSVSKRLSWGAQPFQTMMADLGKRYIWGLKDHMPAKMAIRLLGENGLDWDEITRLDLNTEKDVDVLIISNDKQKQESEMRKEKRIKALELLAQSPDVNSRKRAEAILKDIGEYDDQEIAEFLDAQSYSDKKSLAKASEAIQDILRGKTPPQWFGATPAFMQKIVDYATDKRVSLKGKYDIMLDYATSHTDIVKSNLERKASLQNQATIQQQGAMQAMEGASGPIGAETLPKGMQGAMNMATSAM